MFESYALESYVIPNNPLDIAIEDYINNEVGNGKLGRKMKRLEAASKNGDQKAAKELKDEITEDAKKIQEAARRERNIQLAKAAFSIASRAVSLAAMIYGLVNSGKESKKWAEITARDKADHNDIKVINDLRQKTMNVNKISTGVDIASGLVSMLL